MEDVAMEMSDSPELDPADSRDRYMQEFGQVLDKESPASFSLDEALGDISIIDVPTPLLSSERDEQTPMVRHTSGRARRRVLAFDTPGAPAQGVRVPHGAAGPALFDVYTDTPTTLQNTSRTDKGPVLVKREVANVARAAPFWQLELSNVSGKGRTTKVIRTGNPDVDDRQLLHGGRCVVSFHPDFEDLDPAPLGVITIEHALLPAKPAQREERSGMLLVDPVYVVPPARHLTLVMPSTHPSTLVDHFVVDLLDDLDRSVVRLAIAKVVLARLLFVSKTELKFYDVPVAGGFSVSLVIQVQRLRNDRKNGRLLVAVEQVDWYVPNGLERLTGFGVHVEVEEEVEMEANETEGWSDVETRLPVTSIISGTTPTRWM